MKRSVLCILLCIVMLLPLLTACGDPEPTAPEAPVRADGPTEGPASFAFVNAKLNIPCEADIELPESSALTASCTHNGYLYYTLRGSDGLFKVCRRDLQGVDADKEGSAADLGDAVSMCYNTAENKLVVAHGDKTLSMIDPETLTVTDTYQTSAGTVECITYLKSEGSYAVRVVGKRNLILLDSGFAQTRISSLPGGIATYTVLDMTADSDYIYFLVGDQTGENNKKYAGVLIYHPESGKCLRNVFTFDTANRKLTSIAINGADFLVGTSSPLLGDAFFGGALEQTGEVTLATLVSRTIERDTNTAGISSELLFKTYKLSSTLGANNVMQGGCTDGKYGYFCMEDQAGNYEDTSLHRTRIVKVDMATGELVDISERLPLHHSNDMCYNPNTNQLMVVHCGKGDNARGLTYVDPDSLEITGTASLPIGFYCMAYDEVNDRYMVGSNGRNFAILDGNFNVLIPKVNVGSAGYCKEEELITQGSDCDSEYVYVVLGGRNSSGPWVNYLVVYDWNGNLIMAKIIPNMTAESENIFHIGSTIYVACNGDDEPVYRIELAQ